MRNERSIAALLALAVVALVAADARAMYNPHTGRFLQRDPVGTGDIVIHYQQGGPRIMVAAGVVNPIRDGLPAGTFIPRDPLPVQSRVGQAGANNQYADGMNLYEYAKSKPTVLLDYNGMQSSQPSSQPDKSKVCCRYEKGKRSLPGYSHENPWATRDYLNKWQETRKACPSNNDPKCACHEGFTEYDTRNKWGYGKWALIKGASWGKCCSCKVEGSRATKPWGGYPNHVLITASCDDGTNWYADYPPGGAGSPLPSFVLTEYPTVLQSHCLSCAAASELRQRAGLFTKDNGYSYGFWHDCYWYVRTVMEGNWEYSDGCK